MSMKHALTEGFKKLSRSFWLSATAISVLVVSLGSVALMVGLRTSIGYSLKQLDKQVSIVFYFKDNIPDEGIQGMKSNLESYSEVGSVKYISKEDARQNLSIDISSVADDLDEDPLMDSLVVVPKNLDVYSDVYNILDSEKYNDLANIKDDGSKDIAGNPDVINTLQNIYWWINVLGVALVAVFALISILVMINILRISIYSHKDEIEIMRLLGATNGYIQGPFIILGGLFNLLASVIVIFVFVVLSNYLIPYLEDILDVSSDSSLILNMYLGLFTVMILGLLIGILTSYFATKKYQKL